MGLVIPNAPTPAQVRQRIIDIAETIVTSAPGVLANIELDEEKVVRLQTLPALVAVSIGGATPSRQSTDIARVTRTFRLLVLFYKLTSTSRDEQLAATDAAWSRLDELPDWFWRHAPRLQLNGNVMSGISTTRMTEEEDELAIIPWGRDAKYSSRIYTLPVTMMR